MLYTTSVDGVTPDMLKGFFHEWPHPPDEETHLSILKNSYKVVLAIDETKHQVVGFINVISDGILSIMASA